jgi:hypothetical protein
MGNAQLAVERAFADEAIDDMIEAGASAVGAFSAEGAACLNLETGLSSWKASLSTSTRNHVLVFGDSNTGGPETFRWPAQLALSLQTYTGRPAGGPGFRHLGNAEWVLAAGWTRVQQGLVDVAPLGQAYQAAGPGASAPLATWTPPAGLIAHDRFVIYAVDPGLIGVGDFDWSDDGGAFTGTAINYTPADYNLRTATPVVATIATSLRVRANNPFGPSVFAGVAFYNGDGTNGPLIVHNLGHGGIGAADVAGSIYAVPDTGMPSLYQSPVGVGDRLKIIDNLAPKLTIVAVGGIDYLNYSQAPLVGTKVQTQLDVYESNMNRIVARARQFGDVLVVSPHTLKIPDAFTSFPMNIKQREYARIARAIAWRNDAAYVNLAAMWGTWTRMNARGWMTDSLHLNNLGHTKMAAFLARTIQRVS